MMVYIVGVTDGVLGVYNTEEKALDRFKKELKEMNISKEDYSKAINNECYSYIKYNQKEEIVIHHCEVE